MTNVGRTVFREREAKREATGWRDEWISRRRRAWGFDAPAVDIDFLVIEYDHAEPVGLVEFKSDGDEQVPFEIYSRSASCEAIRKLSVQRTRELPFFVVYYRPRRSFSVYPANLAAHELIPEPTRLAELPFVELLYRLRGREVPPNVKANVGVDGMTTRQILSGR